VSQFVNEQKLGRTASGSYDHGGNQFNRLERMPGLLTAAEVETLLPDLREVTLATGQPREVILQRTA